MYPFERFTKGAKKVLTLAQQEAEAARQTYIGTEHLLLGLLRDSDGVACRALNALGVEIGPAREAIQAALDRAEAGERPQHIIPTARVKKVIEIAFEEARRMGHSYVGTEHLLFGMLIEAEGLAARVLGDLGVTIQKAREQVGRMLEAGPGEKSAAEQLSPWMAGGLLMSPELGRLLIRAQTQAVNRGAPTVGLDHLLQAMTGAAGTGALERLFDLHRITAKKEQAIAAQDYEAAARYRAEEKLAREALERAVAEWAKELG